MMEADQIQIVFSENDEGQKTLLVDGQHVKTLGELINVAPRLKDSDLLTQYCGAVNYLEHGYEFRLILDGDAFRTRYQDRIQSEDPKAPFQEGVVRLRDFGLCDTTEITSPRNEQETVVFYVEDDYLGIPYRVTAPGPDKPDGEVSYVPLPMKPISE